ncbi:Os05g0597400 [Oryza sativa Japonica Group]|uniref:Os05g0597400 protein n=1 Tax=Oryza sativa subsp. japonica TaxID=39947 RepID=A0A0N7KLD2_ORYSJ|nr:hypothetical protein EE612_031536 [Oryza sativa]BAS95689.1 Os05g0597400 [Oryza sativa Japonica Group]
MEALPDIYPLTGLQIGDMQSYVSRAFLYFAPLSKKVFILVDNQPWRSSKQSRSARLWQFMGAPLLRPEHLERHRRRRSSSRRRVQHGGAAVVRGGGPEAGAAWVPSVRGVVERRARHQLPERAADGHVVGAGGEVHEEMGVLQRGAGGRLHQALVPWPRPRG